MGTIANPLSGLIEGLLQGHQLGQQIKRQQMQEQAFKQNQIEHEQRMSVQDIMNQPQIRGMGRPVDELGMVSDQTEQGPNIGGIAAPSFEYQRKAKGPVSYKTRAGETIRVEPYSPDEQFSRMMAQKQAAADIGKIDIAMPAHMRALGMPASLKVSPRDVIAFARESGQMEPVELPEQLSAAAGGVKSVPSRNLPAVLTQYGREQDRAGRKSLTEYQERQRNARNTESVTGANTRATDAQAAANKRAADRNATTLKAADKRKADAAPDRQQRRLDAAKKELRGIQAKEDAAYATRSGLAQKAVEYGKQLKGEYGKLSGEEALKVRTRLENVQASMRSLELQAKAFQTQKAKLIKEFGGGPPAAPAAAPVAAPVVAGANPYR